MKTEAVIRVVPKNRLLNYVAYALYQGMALAVPPECPSIHGL
jgi:hypothetical protein